MIAELPTLSDVEEARSRLAGNVHVTPLLRSRTFDRLTHTHTFFKAENFQRIGAFKIRGAANKMQRLTDDEKSRGVVTFSSGNHAQAAALAARLENIRCVVVMPEDVRPSKRKAAEGYGAEVEIAGTTSDDRYNRAMELQKKFGYTVIHPYNDPDIIAGQGTCGLEIIEQLPDVDVVLIPVGGGGLISGCALAIKSRLPAVKVIGVETEGADDAHQSFSHKKLVKYDSTSTIADGMRNLSLGDLNFEVIMQYADDMLTVSDREVIETMRFFFERMKIVAEPTGAVASTAVRVHSHLFRDKKICAIISGGNIGAGDFLKLLQNT